MKSDFQKMTDMEEALKFKERSASRLCIGARLIFALMISIVFMPLEKVEAKDLSHRLGIGYRDSYSFPLPSMAVQYYPNTDFGIISALGIDTEDKNSRFAFSFGMRKIIFKEENLNFFFGGILTLANTDDGIDKRSGFEMAATVGSEFFLQGLDSLGFNVETGVAVSNLNKVRFRTLGDSFVKSGIIFYF